MPKVGYGIRCYAIIFRRPALFNFAHCPNFKCRVSERKTALTGGGRELERFSIDVNRNNKGVPTGSQIRFGLL